MSADLIKRPVFWVIIIAIWSLVFPLITGAYNSVYTNTIEAASITAERFDRIFPKGSHTGAEDAWQSRTATVDHGGTAAALSNTSAYMVGDDGSDDCEITATVTAGTEFYTPSGNLVTTNASGIIANCEWKERSPIFGVFNGFVRVLLQMLALAAPLGFMLALSYFGSMLISMGGGQPIIQIVMTVVLVLIGAILLNIVLPYISGVFYAIDSERFVVFDQELGLVAGLLRNFFGVILVAGVIGSAWAIIGQMRASSAGGGRAAYQGSGM